MVERNKIGIVGGGKMGGALIGGMISGGLFPAAAMTVADTDERRLAELVPGLRRQRDDGQPGGGAGRRNRRSLRQAAEHGGGPCRACRDGGAGDPLHLHRGGDRHGIHRGKAREGGARHPGHAEHARPHRRRGGGAVPREPSLRRRTWCWRGGFSMPSGLPWRWRSRSWTP